MAAAVTWLQRSIGVDVTGEWARHLHLNVGGVLYTTRRHTLRNYREHPLFGPILSGHAHRCEDGSFLIDGDGTLFRYVLDYLRHGTLTVPDNFHEWEMLLQEVRYYQLAELEKLVLDRFEYQRCTFARQLPHGVYVWWPTVSSPPAPAATSSGDHRTADPPTHEAPGPLPHPPGTSPFPTATASTGQDGSGEKSRPALGTAVLATTPASPLPLASSSAGHGDTGGIRVVPPLPGLVVDAATGAFVTFRGAQVLHDLDQLVTVLLTAYGYTIQHWDEARGRVLLTLPGAL